jgi:hypothetical protein
MRNGLRARLEIADKGLRHVVPGNEGAIDAVSYWRRAAS